MNQINLDSLLQLGSTSSASATTGVLAPLKISPDTLYQGLLNIGRDGGSQLQMSTPQGPALIKLTPEQTSLLLAGQPTTSPTTSAAQPQRSPDVLPSLPQQGLIKLDLQLRQLPSGQLQLQVQSPATPLPSLPLSASSLVSLLGAKDHSNVLQLQIALKRSGDQLLLQLPNQRQLQLPLSFLPQSSQWPQQFQTPALLLLDGRQQQLQIKLQLSSDGQSVPAAEQTSHASSVSKSTGLPQQNNSAASLTERIATSATPLLSLNQVKTVQLSAAQTRELLPVLVKSLQPLQLNPDSKVGADNKTLQQWLHTQPNAAQTLNAKQAIQLAQGVDWQLIPPGHKSSPQSQWQLQISPMPAKTTVLDLSPQQLNRPLQLPIAGTDNSPKNPVDMSQLWRQWLPFSSYKADPLRLLPELPASLNAVISELKAQTLDVAKPMQSGQLLQQLNAALQFNPLQQMPANIATSSAGTLAVALQLLLGRLAGVSTPETKNPVTAKLQQLIGQLDNSQSSQLLRQLSSHASTLQGSQLASVEQQQQPQQQQQLFLQLPLQQQGDSRFAELAISEREADGKSAGAKIRQWQLTMKFDLAELGPLLVQLRLTGQDVSLQFYAEQEKVVHTAQQFLPLFKDRLKLQGISVSEAQCQLGKIPAQLYQRSNSLLAIKV